MLSNTFFDKEIKEMRDFIRDIRKKWLLDRGQIDPKKDYNYEYSYEKTETLNNFDPCPHCGETKGRKKHVTEYTYENGKTKGKAFNYCDTCGKSVEYDYDNTKAIEGEDLNKSKGLGNVQSKEIPKYQSVYSEQSNLPPSSQYSQNVPQSSQNSQNVPQSSQYSQNVPQSSQYYQNVPQSSQYSQNIPQSSQYSQNVSQSSQYSQNIPKSSDYSQNIPQSTQYSQNIPSTQKYQDPTH